VKKAESGAGAARARAKKSKARKTPTPLARSPDRPAYAARRGSKAASEMLERLGISRNFDLVLHLPLRYDDETRLCPISDAPPGQAVLVEGCVVECDVKYRPRRQLVCHIEDGSGVLTLRFLHFYPSQVKQLAPGTRIRVFGELRQGFFGAEVVHPRY
jgi:ATP-dependent DNA helicase RecG